MDDVYKNIEECNLGKKRKVLRRTLRSETIFGK